MKGFSETQHGVIILEFAIVLPMLMVLLSGAVELGLTFRDHELIIERLRATGVAASRYLPVSADPGGELCGFIKNGLEADLSNEGIDASVSVAPVTIFTGTTYRTFLFSSPIYGMQITVRRNPGPRIGILNLFTTDSSTTHLFVNEYRVQVNDSSMGAC